MKRPDGPPYADFLRDAGFPMGSNPVMQSFRHQLRMIESGSVREIAERWRRDDAIARNADLLAPFGKEGGPFRIDGASATDRLVSLSAVAVANESARMAFKLALPSDLEAFRTPFEPLSARLLAFDALGLGCMGGQLEAFVRTSALSDVFAQSPRVDQDLLKATRAFNLSTMPALDTLAAYRGFLDAAGLHLPRWPTLRLLSAAEKRRRFKARLRERAEPPHVRKAKSLVHRYELTLREIVDGSMAAAYGEDWPDRRLPLCESRDLLGRWRKRGGGVLDHADYAHYARIMCHPEHFETVFGAGFDDRIALGVLMDEAGRLRAASHHSRPFTPEDLRDLRVVWRTLETGLLALTDDYEAILASA